MACLVKKWDTPDKYTRDVRFVNELPLNPSGKLPHFRLREAIVNEREIQDGTPLRMPRHRPWRTPPPRTPDWIQEA